MKKNVVQIFSGSFGIKKSTNISVLFRTEEGGFEPPRRDYRPTGVRSQTLQPLGYSSKNNSLPIEYNKYFEKCK